MWAFRSRDTFGRPAEKSRITLRAYAKQYEEYARIHKRSWRKEKGRVASLVEVLGDRKLDTITTRDIEAYLTRVRDGDRVLTPATCNRYRDLLSGMFKRAVRLGLVPVNPVKGIEKAKESGGRIVYLPLGTSTRPAYEEDASREALPTHLRPAFTMSIHTGLRWSEQAALQWRDIDMLAGMITVGRSKNGFTRQIAVNSITRSVLVDLATQRKRPADPTELVFDQAYRTVARAFQRAVQQARNALFDVGRDPSHLAGYTWHGNRHTFASRLVMAGVDLLSVQKLGGWRTLSMVQRYAHLAPGHLHEAVERLVLARN